MGTVTDLAPRQHAAYIARLEARIAELENTPAGHPSAPPAVTAALRTGTRGTTVTTTIDGTPVALALSGPGDDPSGVWPAVVELVHRTTAHAHIPHAKVPFLACADLPAPVDAVVWRDGPATVLLTTTRTRRTTVTRALRAAECDPTHHQEDPTMTDPPCPPWCTREDPHPTSGHTARLGEYTDDRSVTIHQTPGDEPRLMASSGDIRVWDLDTEQAAALARLTESLGDLQLGALLRDAVALVEGEAGR